MQEQVTQEPVPAPVPTFPVPPVVGNPSAGPGHAGSSGNPGMTAAPGPVFHITMKPREPPIFSGKTSEDVENWIYTVSAYFRTVAAPEQQKVGYALTFLQDAAREWWINRIRMTGREPGTWQELAEALRARFGHSTKEMTARAELRVIKQQKGENVRVYAARFHRLLGHLPTFDEAWAKDQFSSGLAPRVAELLLLKSPRSLQDFAVEAERIELTMKYAQHTRATEGQNQAAASSSNQGNRGGWYGRGRQGRGRGRGAGSDRTVYGTVLRTECWAECTRSRPRTRPGPRTATTGELFSL